MPEPNQGSVRKEEGKKSYCLFATEWLTAWETSSSSSLGPTNVALCSKRTLQMWLNQGSWDGEINLDFSGTADVIKSLLKRGKRGNVKEKRIRPCDEGSGDWSGVATSHQKVEEAGNGFSLGASSGNQHWRHLDLTPARLVSDSWPPEL